TKEFLQRVIDSSVDAIVSADMRGNVLLFNPAAERTYGYGKDEVIGKRNVAALYPANAAREIMRRMQAAGAGGVLEGYETELLGYATLSAKRAAGDERMTRAAERMVTETERMAEIVRKIGKLTKYETKTYVGDTKILDLDRSVESEPPISRY